MRNPAAVLSFNVLVGKEMTAPWYFQLQTEWLLAKQSALVFLSSGAVAWSESFRASASMDTLDFAFRQGLSVHSQISMLMCQYSHIRPLGGMVVCITMTDVTTGAVHDVDSTTHCLLDNNPHSWQCRDWICGGFQKFIQVRIIERKDVDPWQME